MDDPLGKMLAGDHKLIQARAYLGVAYEDALLALRGVPFYRDMYRATMRDNVKRAAELLGLTVSEAEGRAGCVELFPAVHRPCDSEP
jgi:hypothetical protein